MEPDIWILRERCGYQLTLYPTKDGSKGVVRKITIPDCSVFDGKVDRKSLNAVLKDISNKTGQSGNILGAYFESDQFDAMEKFAQTKLKESNIDLLDHTYNKDRTPYSLTDNNCGTFASDVINQDKNVKNAWWSIKTPTNMVDEFLEEGYEKVFYNSETQQTTFEK